MICAFDLINLIDSLIVKVRGATLRANEDNMTATTTPALLAPRSRRERIKCDVCGTPTINRYRVWDGSRTYLRNGAQTDGPTAQPLCTRSCAKQIARDPMTGRMVAGWRVEEIR